MRIQNLAVIFIIIILPISLVLASYTQNRVQILSIQTNFDSKLNDATYDALKAYQLNSFNSDTSDYTNSKMRDIKASVNTFFNTMSTSFSSLGYTKETLQNYVPALVYTMYDGYYIYSPYKNTWDDETKAKHGDDTSYRNDDKLYGLKPYVYYSCRYKNASCDVTITYSLDNYIQIQGYILEFGNKKTVSKAGYLLSNLSVNGDIVIYNNVNITPESALKENVYVDGNYMVNLSYIKKNGTKYYTDGTNVFSVLNGKSIKQAGMIPAEINNNRNAIEYYKQAYELKSFIISSPLKDLRTNDIVGLDGVEYYKIDKIFDFDNGNGIESETSNFNTHRIDVIKNSIERNLSIAIANFNNYSNVTTDFEMPKLTDSDWDKIMDNISIISFLQGINMGGKLYNGYSIITNTKNEDIVMEDSIYIMQGETFHRITETGLSSQNGSMVGIYNVNLERRSAETTSGNTEYYFPVYGMLSYDSIVTQNKIAKSSDESLYDYVKNKLSNELKKVYYTALGRERYGLYRRHYEI